MSQSLVPGSSVPTTVPQGGRTRTSQVDGTIVERQRDFLLLTIFVLAQQGDIDRAGVLAEALHVLGDKSAEIQMARAVLRFLAGEWAATIICLEELDRIDPIERFGDYTPTPTQRMRRYLSARCLFELGDVTGSRNARDVYLRQGRRSDGADEK